MNYLYAFILGILSIVGPCTFIMVPVILNKIKNSLVDVIYFFSGILIIFISLGIIASLTGFVFTNSVNRYLYFIAGIVTLISGFSMLGAVKMEYPHLQEQNTGGHTFIDGLLHGGVILGCIGPQLASILTFIIAQRNIVNGIFMIVFYGIGFITPFFIFGLIITDKILQLKLMKYTMLIQKIGGVLMLATSVYLIYFSLQGYI
ncbi:MAG: cytochrome c biogenesis protein CcdA [Patescibacteria group bacterium]